MSFGKKLLPAQKGNAAGFTLIEILVAMTIFSFAVLGMAAGTVTLTRTNQNSHLHTSAVNLAQARLEDFRAMTAATFAALACPDFGAVGCTDSVVEAGATFNRSWRIDFPPLIAGANKIDVQVTWTDYTNQSVTISASVFFP
jgi:prepilin-type N-terminal cleavage/methylation domain-containing protein